MRFRSIFALWILAEALSLPLRAGDPEDELKAATVLTFLRHAEWAQGPGAGPLTVAVLGRSAMIKALHQSLEGKAVNNRPVRIIDWTNGAELPNCQVLYLALANQSELKPALAAARGAKVLTIGESGRFLDLGGAVNLMIVDGHMSFEVDLEAVNRSGVAISSTLLRYGRVRGRPPA